MKNFPIEHEGKTYWISRSCAVAAFIFAVNEKGETHVLINKRGPGCPNEIGKWSCPCGYLDYGETGSEAAAREVFEETGLRIPADSLRIAGVNFSVANNQNVTVRYKVEIDWADVEELEKEFTTEHSEPNEVDEIKFIPISEISNYDMAFGHDKVIPIVFASDTLEESTVKE